MWQRRLDGWILSLSGDATASKNSDAEFFFKKVFLMRCNDAFEPIPMDQSSGFDSFVFDEDTIDEACDNADLMDELFP